ncbi:MAG: hypothetical protein DMF64_19085 [Acidobacteria bacterium]|nr:MAG: hypothetical protein DMF64_19085 [Acidobacteriota bacterium]
MRAHAHLGRKQTRTERALRRGVLRRCVVCGFEKPAREFQARKRSRVLNIFCNQCGQDKARVNAVLMPAGLSRSHRRRLRRAAFEFLLRLARRRFLKKGEKGMAAEEYAMKVAKLPDRVAAIIGKTYAEQGDAATLADDEALMMVRDLLLEIDDTLIDRNKNKRLSRR